MTNILTKAFGRRGFLKGAAAAPLAAPTVAQAAIPTAGAPYALGEVMAGQGLSLSPGGISAGRAWDAFHKAMEAPRRATATKRAVMELCGGMPPHVGVLRSVAPHTRARLAAQWALELRRQEDSVADRLQRALGLRSGDA